MNGIENIISTLFKLNESGFFIILTIAIMSLYILISIIIGNETN